MLVYVLAALLILPSTRATTDIYLSGNLVPQHYDLLYTFDIDPQSKFAFVGVVSIIFTVQNRINKIVLHADSFNISENKLFLATDAGDVPAITDIDMSDSFDFMVISLSSELKPRQNFTLVIPFWGNLNRHPYGLFMTSYKLEDQQEKYMVLSNFKPMGAHRAFPCFDEPRYKATFSIVIGHHVNMKAISNMPILKSTNDNPLHKFWPMSVLAERFKTQKEVFAWDKFAETPAMSTYLVAIIVTDMSSMVKTKVKDNQIEVKIWSRNEKLKSYINDAANVIQKLVAAESDHLKYKYPLHKFDVLAVPELPRPCLEHWGLLVCAEDVVFYNKEPGMSDVKELALTELSEKIARQWFGGLVTTEAWNDSWINEGLVRSMVPIAVAAVDKDDKFQQNYLIQHFLKFLYTDSIRSALPLRMVIEDPRDIVDALNSDVTLGKAYLIMNMIYKLMTYDTYTLAIQKYLTDNAHSVADFTKFCSSFSAYVQYSKLPALASFKDMLEPWVRQEGYPLLKVYRDTYSDNALKLNQQHYVAPKGDSQSQYPEAWWIPFSVVTRDFATVDHYWLPVEDGQASQPYVIQQTANVSAYIIVNSDSMTPMRVVYDEKNWVTVIQILSGAEMSSIPVVARAQLLSDAFALAWSGHIDYNIPISLANYLQNETEWAPFHAAFLAFERIDMALTGSIHYTVLQKYVTKLIEGLYTPNLKYRVTNDLYSNKLQVAVFQWACKLKLPDCERSAIGMYDDWMKTWYPRKNPIPAALRSMVCRVAVSRGGGEQWRHAVLVANSTERAARRRLLPALVCTSDLPLLKTALEWTVSDALPLCGEERVRMLQEALLQPYSYPVARELIYTKTTEILRRCGDYMGDLLKTLTRKFTTQQELNEFDTWSEKYRLELDKFRLAIRQGVDLARGNIYWMTNHHTRVIELMNKHMPGSDNIRSTRRKSLEKLFSPNFSDILLKKSSADILCYSRLFMFALLLFAMC